MTEVVVPPPRFTILWRCLFGDKAGLPFCRGVCLEKKRVCHFVEVFVWKKTCLPFCRGVCLGKKLVCHFVVPEVLEMDKATQSMSTMFIP